MNRRVASVVGLLAVVLSGAIAAAQDASAGGGTVSGAGTVSVKRRPESLRVTLQVFASGKTTKEALANLKDRREAVRGQLSALGAAKESVTFGDPEVDASLLEGRQQMEMMIRRRMGKAAKKDDKKSAAPTVVRATLTAEWPLKGADTDALLVEIGQLKENITAADLAGRKDLEKVGGDDEEMKEELEGVEMGNMNNDGRQQAGAPTFLLVSKVTPEDQAKALAEAFAKAKAKAAGTAKAAGAELGALRQVDSQMKSGDEGGDEGTPAAYYRAMREAGGGGLHAEPDAPLEAQGSQPGAVSFRVTVTASFGLK